MKRQLPAMTEQVLRGNKESLALEVKADLNTVFDIARHHCERMDGSGYPDGLRGYEISFAARLVGLADVLDTLLNHNLTSPKQSVEKAGRLIRKSGIALFGSDVIACFEQRQSDIYELYLNYRQRVESWA